MKFMNIINFLLILSPVIAHNDLKWVPFLPMRHLQLISESVYCQNPAL